MSLFEEHRSRRTGLHRRRHPKSRKLLGEFWLLGHAEEGSGSRSAREHEFEVVSILCLQAWGALEVRLRFGECGADHRKPLRCLNFSAWVQALETVLLVEPFAQADVLTGLCRMHPGRTSLRGAQNLPGRRSQPWRTTYGTGTSCRCRHETCMKCETQLGQAWIRKACSRRRQDQQDSCQSTSEYTRAFS